MEDPKVTALRDVSPEALEAARPMLPSSTTRTK